MTTPDMTNHVEGRGALARLTRVDAREGMGWIASMWRVPLRAWFAFPEELPGDRRFTDWRSESTAQLVE